jgi:hypothetical protein
MPRVGFESTIPASERMKTIHALDLAAILIGGECGNSVVKRNPISFYSMPKCTY